MDKGRRKPQYIGITELEEITGIPNASVKRYVLTHNKYIEQRKIGRQIRVNVNAIETVKLIRQMYNSGLNRYEVDERLEHEGMPVTYTVEEDETLPVSLNDELSNMKDMLQQILINDDYKNKQIERLENEIKSLKESQNEKNEGLVSGLSTLKSDIEARDKELLKTIKENMEETKKAKEEASKSWISRLFNTK